MDMQLGTHICMHYYVRMYNVVRVFNHHTRTCMYLNTLCIQFLGCV